jgi:hypothetical protein
VTTGLSGQIDQGRTAGVTGGFTSIDGVDCYKIDDVDLLEPFLTTVVSDADLWMFVSSAGSLTAGRVDANHAIFPYLTDDRIHAATGSIGPVTAIARTVDGVRDVWRPFHAEKAAQCRRSLAKSVLGDRLIFEETNPRWQLRIRATWAPSRKYGWVRTTELLADGAAGEFEVLDGVLDVMPSGVDVGTEQTRSNLVDAYKRAECMAADGRLAVYNLESLITDKAEPGEALTATAVWSLGFDGAVVDLDPRSVRRFLAARSGDPAPIVTGRPAAYLLRGPVRLGPGGRVSWSIMHDTGLDHASLGVIAGELALGGVATRVSDDLAAGSDRLRELLAGADGMQRTGDPMADAHHLSNVLFNSMRGGVFPHGQRIPMADFIQFAEERNRLVVERHRPMLDHAAPWDEVAALRAMAEATEDPDLLRIVLEYLPLTFSRRHGDPSRPWNRFSIHVTDGDGSEILHYEGNWRDIFQNWEALLHSYPGFFSHVVAKFVNASTLDGYNPYRISREGVDWEVPDPHDPWANIGYWGDHQIAYLLRLVEGWERFEPGAIGQWLNRPVFVYADVPYQICDRAQMIADPRNTITFLDDREAAVADRVARLGGDGRLVIDAAGDLLRVGLAEKLLVPALSKMSNHIPGAGIWMNTQRPEWNDANNALAGPGVSMVTVFHLHRYLRFLRERFDGRDTIHVSRPVADWLRELTAVYRTAPRLAGDDATRRAMVDALGEVADAQGQRLLAPVRPDLTEVAMADVLEFFDLALAALEQSIDESIRPDGLVDSYNLISFPTGTTAEVERLGPMLEGQVAALAAGVLSPEELVRTIDALFDSSMYRPDLGTFMLYPVVELEPFAERNLVPEGLLPAGVETRMPDVLVRDGDGRLRFRSAAANAAALDQLLDHDGVAEPDRSRIHAAYEQVFGHAGFTGRSGSMYGYEGIGSVYWHMVSKLLLAAQDAYWSAVDLGASAAVTDDLRAAYRRIRAGLGFVKEPAVFGAFPVDCYSHSPAHSGAQQPGMTGQVKEEVIARFGELGLRVAEGRISLQPGLLDPTEVFAEEPEGATASFTFCAVPMIIRRGATSAVRLVMADGEVVERGAGALTAAESALIFARTGDVLRVEWQVAAEQ